MTKAELIKALEEFDDAAEVFVRNFEGDLEPLNHVGTVHAGYHRGSVILQTD